jgi:hypothetical protein
MIMTELSQEWDLTRCLMYFADWEQTYAAKSSFLHLSDAVMSDLCNCQRQDTRRRMEIKEEEKTFGHIRTSLSQRQRMSLFCCWQ